MPSSRRSQRRQRHLNKPHSSTPPPPGPPNQQDFATAGNERAALKNPSRDPKNLSDFDAPTYGEGFGKGPGHGAESSASGLEGASNRERDYRGNAGTTFGAVVGPDALKPDPHEDNQRRPDPKPEE